jgi:Protein of unknown function (DUF1161)
MQKLLLAFAASIFSSLASGANTCDALRAQIDAKIRASGVARFTLSTVEADAKVNGRVVGTCDLGTRKIVYAQDASPAATATGSSNPAAQPSPARPRNETILTECKDGSVSVGGDCKK